MENIAIPTTAAKQAEVFAIRIIVEVKEQKITLKW